MWATLRTRLILLAILTCLAFAGFAAYQGQLALVHSHTLVTGRVATDMVQKYVETHNGRWPSSWEALATVNPGEPWNHSSPQISPSIQQRVAIDFAADPAQLARQSKAEFTAIRPAKAPPGDYRDYWQIESLLGTLRKYHPQLTNE
jgi:hypothetical protein